MAKIGKADAAERLIAAAIGIVESGGDPLAAHLLATSALGVLRDLIRNGEQEYVSSLIKVGMFTLAEQTFKGEEIDQEIPTHIADQIGELALAIERGEVSKSDDLNVKLDEPWKLLDYIVGPSNFLKHADRDPLEALDEEGFEPEGAIEHALTAFGFACPGRSLPAAINPYLERHGYLK